MASRGSAKKKGLTKAQLVADLAARTGLPKAAAAGALEALAALATAELKAGRPVTVPGLVKLTLQNKPATLARPGRNPFTGEAITIKAKPARRVVRPRVVKALKDAV